MPLVFAIIALVAIMVLMPRPKPPGMKRPTEDDLDVPTAEEGKEIPVLFGTRTIKNANCVWYGHLKTKAVKAKGGKK